MAQASTSGVSSALHATRTTTQPPKPRGASSACSPEPTHKKRPPGTKPRPDCSLDSSPRPSSIRCPASKLSTRTTSVTTCTWRCNFGTARGRATCGAPRSIPGRPNAQRPVNRRSRTWPPSPARCGCSESHRRSSAYDKGTAWTGLVCCSPTWRVGWHRLESGTWIACAPHRDVLLLARAEAMQELRARGEDAVRRAPHPVSAAIFAITPQGPRPLRR